MGFERCHPAVNFIYFASVIAGTLIFKHPIFLGISFVSAFIYSILRNGKKALYFNLGLLPLVFIFALYYSSYNHFGLTVIRQNLVGNNLTLESFAYGTALGLSVAGMCIWFSCLYSVFSSDKVIYLFGKVSPRISLFLAILLRMVPRIKKEARRINTAQLGIGRGVSQGTFFERVKNCLRVFSMLVTWTIESLATASDSMRSRGSTLRGRKAFSIYRFDNRDRAYVIGVFICITITVMAVLLHQTDMQYDPQMVFNPITSMSPLFFLGYAVLCLMPVFLELWTAYRFKKSRNSV